MTNQITRTELLWPGKYHDDGMLNQPPRANLPLQVVETLNPGPSAADWHNKLIWADNLLVMGSLLKDFAGKIDLIYIDPPFATGADFSFTAANGVETQAYRDTWKDASYLAMMADRLRLIRDLLSPKGTLFLHCDWHTGHLLRVIADEVFAPENFLNEIVWYYYNKFQGNVKRFASNHDVIFWYRKTAAYQFNPQVEKRAEGKVKQLVRRWDKEKASIVNAKTPDGRVMYRETDERTVDDVWRISMLQPADRTENCGFPTQKPEALLRRIVQAASSEGDLLADFFCGSGTMLAAAEKLNRRWIGCDFGRWGIHATRKRLLGIKGCKPFALLSLGKHERRHWQKARFGEDQKQYRNFLLNLYGAQPAHALTHNHGEKGKALVHIGAVDEPMQQAVISAALDECVKHKRRELHILSWDWASEARQQVVELARNKGVKLLLLQIAREVMEPQATPASPLFHPLAHFEVAIDQPEKLTVRVALKNFVIENPELPPVPNWSDYIDYWSVDWHYQNEPLTHGWAAYRTRKENQLPLLSGLYTYQQPGTHRLLIQVIDIFGNETRQAMDVEMI